MLKVHGFQVWDATTGQKQYVFEGHEAPVYSVCPHHKEAIQVFLSSVSPPCLVVILLKIYVELVVTWHIYC